MGTCEYQFFIPGIGICCNAYSKAKLPNGLHWANYPDCKAENCPLKNPALLGDAILGKE